MTHVRRDIREAVATALTGLATTGARVYQSRIFTLRDADLPCLLINTDDEAITNATLGSQILERQLTVTVRCVAKANANLDDTLDQIIEEVEPVLNGATLSGSAKNLQLQGIGIEMVDTLDKPAGVATLTYTATYYTAGNAPGVPL
jgi:hypothetical protein